MIRESVHPHGYREIFQGVQKLAKHSELLERDSLLVFNAIQKTV